MPYPNVICVMFYFYFSPLTSIVNIPNEKSFWITDQADPFWRLEIWAFYQSLDVYIITFTK